MLLFRVARCVTFQGGGANWADFKHDKMINPALGFSGSIFGHSGGADLFVTSFEFGCHRAKMIN